MKKILALTFTLATLATSAIAGPNTGCGLGNEVIKNQNTVLMQVLAVTTNGTFGNQTFGISFGTLGCAKPASWVGAETQQFVALNMEGLAADIAKGQGEAVDTLADLMKQDRATFASKLQSNFDKIYTSTSVDASAVLSNIKAVL